MYLVTYESKGKVDIGVLTKDKSAVIPLQAAEKHYQKTAILPASINEFLDLGESGVQMVQTILSKLDASGPSIPLADVRVLAPIPRPRKNIFCVGKNYVEHALEFDRTKDASVAVPKYPVIFSKLPTTVIGPNDQVDSHSAITSELDYEVELAVVIGKKGADISQEKAMDYVFGYTIINDVTARDVQKKHAQWLRGKGMDTFAPMGPYLVHKSAVPNPENLSITSKINDELRQNGNTGDLIFKIPELIATISAGITLEPGDIIATGTPAGVAMGFTPPKFLKPGDKMELEITSLGVLCNTIK